MHGCFRSRELPIFRGRLNYFKTSEVEFKTWLSRFGLTTSTSRISESKTSLMFGIASATSEPVIKLISEELKSSVLFWPNKIDWSCLFGCWTLGLISPSAGGLKLYSGGTIKGGFVKIVNSSGGNLFVPRTSDNSLPQPEIKDKLRIKIKLKNICV